MLYALIAAIALIADQWLKYWVTVNITLNTGDVALIPSVIKLVNIHNSGAAFGMLSDFAYAKWLFLAIAAVFVVVIILVLAKNTFDSRFANWCAVFAMAGAVGNCIDRILYGYVVDMFKLEFMDFAIFNVADIFLVVACIAFILYIIVDTFKGKDGDKPEKQKKPRRADDAEDDDYFTAGINTADPDFPEDAVPVSLEPESNGDEFWENFKSQVHKEEAPKAKAKPAPAKPAPAPKAKPAPKVAPKEADEFDLESIMAEFKDL